MTAPWVAGKTYVPGSLVKPLTLPPAISAAPNNPGFESGNFAGWTVVGSWTVVGGSSYAGTYCAELAAAAGDDLTLTNTNQVPVTPGKVINCSLRVKQGAAGSGNAGALIRLHWYDAAHAEIGHNDGDAVFNGGSSYKTAYLTASAPAGAAFAAFGIAAWDHSPSHPMWVDDAAWDYTYSGPVAGLIYKAVQDAPGKSGASEPAWPPVNGEQVIDNQVIWEAVLATRIVWQASPLMVSGATEPEWPVVNGGTVRDGSIDWIAQTPQILDVNCPHSKIVAIAAGKVYAADNDIIRYSATVNPLDWTTNDDAGYLPFGLQTYGSNPVAAMGLYRSNLVAFNAEGFQMWQVDEDPASTALLDALPIGSTQNHATAPVANDLFFLSSQGVRTVGIAAGSTNLQAGDVGMPVDSLIQDAVRQAIADGIEPISTYVPSAGQYWLAFADFPHSLALTGHAPAGSVGEAYSYQYTTTGGTEPILFSFLGALPDGLTLDEATGILSGTPTAGGVFDFSVVATSADQQKATLPQTVPIDALAQTLLDDGPVMLLPLDELSGTVAHDITGNGHDGTYVGAVTLNGGSVLGSRPAAHFPGAASLGYVSVPSTSPIQPGDYFTIEMYVSEDSLHQGSSISTLYTRYIDENDGTSDYSISVVPYSFVDAFGVSANASEYGAYGQVVSPPISRNRVYFVAFRSHIVGGDHQVEIFINGVKNQSGNGTSIPVTSVPLTIGSGQTRNDLNGFAGLIGYVTYYDKQLSDARIYAHAQAAGVA